MGLVRAYLGLGANLVGAPAVLEAAVRALAALPGARLRAVSRLYLTRPVGVADQPPFHNAAVALEVPGGGEPVQGALALVITLKAIERAFGRTPGERWGPRELDLDLLVFGRHQIHVDRPSAAKGEARTRGGVQWLDVPHISARERLFVLAPLADLAPGLVPPGWGECVETARSRQETLEGPEAVRVVGEWDRGRLAWVPVSGEELPGAARESPGAR